MVMLRRLKRLIRQAAPVVAERIPPAALVVAERASQRELLSALEGIPYWEDKIARYKNYEYQSPSGTWAFPSAPIAPPIELFSVDRVNYGCGGTILKGWLNVDLFPFDDPDYRMVNLIEKHPFADNSVSFGYSEDMLEHLTQSQSIFLIAEIYRTLKPGGVMRFSFPGLEGVLNRHYTPRPIYASAKANLRPTPSGITSISIRRKNCPSSPNTSVFPRSISASSENRNTSRCADARRAHIKLTSTPVSN
jgi:SAM-dependent methyltransferase